MKSAEHMWMTDSLFENLTYPLSYFRYVHIIMFNQSTLGTSSGFGTTSTPSSANPMKDFEVTSPPDDSVSSLAFSPATIPQNFLIAGSWDNNVSECAVEGAYNC